MKKRFSVVIIGEGETEWFYFESLRVAKRYPFKIAPTLAQHADIGHMVKLVDYFVKEEFDRVFCLLDMDRLLRVPKEMQVYQNAKRKFSKCKNTKVMFIETNPCTKFWFLLHFLPGLTSKNYATYEDVLPDLRRYLPGYEITESHLQFHPKDRKDVCFLFDIDGFRIYVAGDTEDIPEMTNLKDIDIAFIPVNQPYTMTPKQAIHAINMIQPQIAYPYHYGETDLTPIVDAFQDNSEIEIRIKELQ